DCEQLKKNFLLARFRSNVQSMLKRKYKEAWEKERDQYMQVQKCAEVAGNEHEKLRYRLVLAQRKIEKLKNERLGFKTLYHLAKNAFRKCNYKNMVQLQALKLQLVQCETKARLMQDKFAAVMKCSDLWRTQAHDTETQLENLKEENDWLCDEEQHLSNKINHFQHQFNQELLSSHSTFDNPDYGTCATQKQLQLVPVKRVLLSNESISPFMAAPVASASLLLLTKSQLNNQQYIINRLRSVALIEQVSKNEMKTLEDHVSSTVLRYETRLGHMMKMLSLVKQSIQCNSCDKGKRIEKIRSTVYNLGSQIQSLTHVFRHQIQEVVCQTIQSCCDFWKQAKDTIVYAIVKNHSLLTITSSPQNTITNLFLFCFALLYQSEECKLEISDEMTTTTTTIKELSNSANVEQTKEEDTSEDSLFTEDLNEDLEQSRSEDFLTKTFDSSGTMVFIYIYVLFFFQTIQIKKNKRDNNKSTNAIYGVDLICSPRQKSAEETDSQVAELKSQQNKLMEELRARDNEIDLTKDRLQILHVSLVSKLSESSRVVRELLCQNTLQSEQVAFVSHAHTHTHIYVENGRELDQILYVTQLKEQNEQLDKQVGSLNGQVLVLTEEISGLKEKDKINNERNEKNNEREKITGLKLDELKTKMYEKFQGFAQTIKVLEEEIEQEKCFGKKTKMSLTQCQLECSQWKAKYLEKDEHKNEIENDKVVLDFTDMAMETISVTEVRSSPYSKSAETEYNFNNSGTKKEKELKHAVSCLQEKYNSMAQSFQDLFTENDELKVEKCELQAEVNQLEMQLSKAVADSQEQKRIDKENINKLEEELEHKKLLLLDMQKKEEDMHNKQKENELLHEQIDKLKIDFSQVNEQLTSSVQNECLMKANLDHSHDENLELKTLCDEVIEQNNQLKRDVEDTTHYARQWEGRAKYVEEKLHKAKDEQKLWEEEHQLAMKRISTLEELIQLGESEIHRLQFDNKSWYCMLYVYVNTYLPHNTNCIASNLREQMLEDMVYQMKESNVNLLKWLHSAWKQLTGQANSQHSDTNYLEWQKDFKESCLEVLLEMLQSRVDNLRHACVKWLRTCEEESFHNLKIQSAEWNETLKQANDFVAKKIIQLQAFVDKHEQKDQFEQENKQNKGSSKKQNTYEFVVWDIQELQHLQERLQLCRKQTSKSKSMNVLPTSSIIIKKNTKREFLDDQQELRDLIHVNEANLVAMDEVITNIDCHQNAEVTAEKDNKPIETMTISSEMLFQSQDSPTFEQEMPYNLIVPEQTPRKSISVSDLSPVLKEDSVDSKKNENTIQLEIPDTNEYSPKDTITDPTEW
ncbi:hypothetical protein RFI_12314, partial [Reticulomyxa filosa]